MNKKFFKKILSLILIVTFVFSAFGIVKATAETKAFTLTDASIKEKSDTVEASVSVKDGSVLNNLTFHKLNDYIIYTLTFKNNDTKDYIIKGITDNNGSEYVKYEYDQYADETIKAGETKNIELKVSYIKEVTDIDERSIKDSVKLSFDIEDKDGNKVVANVIVNPKTNDGIGMYIILASASLIGLAVLLLKKKKSGKLLVVAALAIPFVAKAAEASFIITLNGEVKLHDKVLVTTNVNGNKVEELINYSDKFTKPADPVVDGQDFLGWFVGDEKFDFSKGLSDDVVLVAKFKKIEYTVTFDPGSGKVATESISFYKGDKVTAPIPFVERGYKFTGWYDGPDDSDNLVVNKGEEFTPEGNITLYAHYEDGEEINLIDKDANGEASEGDIVNFGSEKFVIIYVSGSTVRAISANPLGNLDHIRQTDTDPIESEYANSTYWLKDSGYTGPNNIYPDSYVYYNQDGNILYTDHFGESLSYFSLAENENLVYPMLSEYSDYLNDMYDFYDELRMLLPRYSDLSDIDCKFNTNNSCPEYLNDGYDFWLGSSIYANGTEEEIRSGSVGYFDKATNSMKAASSLSKKLPIRPVIEISSEDIFFE